MVGWVRISVFQGARILRYARKHSTGQMFLRFEVHLGGEEEPTWVESFIDVLCLGSHQLPWVSWRPVMVYLSPDSWLGVNVLWFTARVVFSFGSRIPSTCHHGVVLALAKIQRLSSCDLLFPEVGGGYCGSQFEGMSVHHSGESVLA